MFNSIYLRSAQPFWTRGRSVWLTCIVHSRDEDWNYELNFRESSIKIRFIYLINLFIACGLIFLSSERFRIAISCKIVNSSIKLKFIHKGSVIQEKFLVFLLTCSEDQIQHVRELDPDRRLCIPDLPDQTDDVQK